MRCLNRNKRTIYYDEPTGSLTAQVDASGYKTGEYTKGYTTPVSLKVNVTVESKAEISHEEFGRVESYDRYLIGSGTCPFGPDARLYIENTTSQGNDYIVGGIEQSLNSYRALCKKVVG